MLKAYKTFAKLSMERHEMIFARKEINLSGQMKSRFRSIGGDVIILKVQVQETTLVAQLQNT
jgi:hypothetical protein